MDFHWVILVWNVFVYPALQSYRKGWHMAFSLAMFYLLCQDLSTELGAHRRKLIGWAPNPQGSSPVLGLQTGDTVSSFYVAAGD